MKPLILIPLFMLLVGCTTSAGLDPIPGSLTYGGQPTTRLTKAPIGSPVHHRFRDQFSQEWEETYLIQPDRSLKLVSRRRVEFPFHVR